MSTFHDYSPNNILLIMAQRPDAVKMASYRRWKTLGRYVKFGVRGIRTPIPDHPEAKGDYLPACELIRVVPRLVGDQASKTLLHETGHVVANHHGWEPREDAETVAEASAFIVCARYGIDTGDYSFPYIATWARDRSVLGRNLTQIQRTSHTIITAIDGRDLANDAQ